MFQEVPLYNEFVICSYVKSRKKTGIIVKFDS